MDKDIKQQQPVGVEPVAEVTQEDINQIVWLCPSVGVGRGSKLYSAETVARLQAERDTNRHLLDKVSANYDTLFDRNAQLQAERDELAELVKTNQWVEYNDPDYGTQRFCPDCRNDKKFGTHLPECGIGKALAKIESTSRSAEGSKS